MANKKKNSGTLLYPGVILRGQSIIVTRENFENEMKKRETKKSSNVIIASKKNASSKLTQKKN